MGTCVASVLMQVPVYPGFLMEAGIGVFTGNALLGELSKDRTTRECTPFQIFAYIS